MAQGLLGDFQPQGVGYGNILMDEPVQYGLDDGFGALAGSLRNVIIDPVLGTLSDAGDTMGDIMANRPIPMSRLQDVSQRAAMDLTGTGMIAGLPTRMAAAEAGDTLLGVGGGVSPARKQRILKEVDDTLSFDPNAVGYYTSLKNRPRMTDLQISRKGVDILEPRKDVRLEGLLGQYLVPAYGDRSATGIDLLGYGGMKFDNPSRQYGGYDFARNVGNAIWSTDRHKKKYYQRAREAQEEGKEAYLGYTTMAGDSGDFNTMTADIWTEALNQSKVSKKDAKKIDEKIRSMKGLEGWVGIHSDKDQIKTYLNSLGGGARAKISKDVFAKGFAEQAGLPKFDEVRRAQTAQELLYMPTYRTGAMIGRITPDAELIGVPDHPTYSRSGDVAGEYVGGLLTPIPDIIAFRDVADRYMDDAGNFLINPKDGKPYSRSNVKYTIDAQAPKQMVDDQMLEEADFYIKSLLNRADGDDLMKAGIY